MKKLGKDFWKQGAVKVAKELLGKELVWGKLRGVILETEAYLSKNDPACHAAKKQTKRNEVMFQEGGVIYVYFTYGMHHCLNFVTGKKGEGEAVLIRSVWPLEGLEKMKERRGKVKKENLSDGPAKFCQAWGIDLKQNGTPLGSKIWVEDKGRKVSFERTERIGIREGKDLQLRFVVTDFDKTK